MEKKKLGILGGMGSEATVLFYKKIIDNTSVNNDREHLDILIYNHASIRIVRNAFCVESRIICGTLLQKISAVWSSLDVNICNSM